VLIDRSGERSFIAAEGADGHVTDADLGLIAARPEDWALLSGYALIYRASRDALTRWLNNLPADARLVFDTSPLVASIPQSTLQTVLHAALWVSANSAEAAALTGETDPTRAAEALVAARPPHGGVLVRDGANGCYLALPGQRARHLSGFPVCAIDTNGAGDAHVGAFIAALARGETPGQAARLANVTAALSTTKEGPSTAPTLHEVLGVIDAGPEPLVLNRR
jgi:sugar/nucleoside kinase (ribokinase family)